MRHVLILTAVVGVLGALMTAQRGASPSGTTPEADRTELVREAVVGGTARNVLLFIGDGLGDAEITLARNYAVGASGRLALDTLPLTGVYTTYSVDEHDPSLPVYVTDSAAAGTGWATGYKTSNGRVSTSAGDDRDLTTILEIAQQRGYRTGNVTTAELTDATPAVLAAHVAHRSCQGPADMAACPQDRRSAGGPGSIAEQELAHNIDYAAAHPGTLLIVTADHAHSSQIVGLPTDADHPSGLLSVLLTADHSRMAVSYGTNAYHRSQDHTGAQVRVAAMGPQAANVVGVRDQTDLFRIILRALDGERSASKH